MKSDWMPVIINKTCTNCKKVLPATSEYFPLDNRNRTGLKARCRNCVAQYHKEHYLAIKEQKKPARREYYKKNRVELVKKAVEWNKVYRREHPDNIRKSAKRRAALKRSLPQDLTFEQWETAKKYFKFSCAYCGSGKGPLEQDHFWPLTMGGGYTKFNIVPSCKSCNSSKGNRPFGQWYRESIVYSKKREDKIYKYFIQLAAGEIEGKEA